MNQIGLVPTPQEMKDWHLPVLQDTLEVNAWMRWGVSYRDVYILDKEGKLAAIWNLNPPEEGGLGIGNAENRENFKALILEIANR